MPFRCPLAPCEAALSLEALFRDRGLKDRTEIHLYTPEGQPMPAGGPKIGAQLRQMLEERGITYHPKHKVLRIDGNSQKILFEDGSSAEYDLLIGVPPHRAPRVVVDAGLTDPSGYIPTHPQTLNILADVETLETKLPGIYAMGDITSITLLNMMKLAKAGVFAEEQASIVAANIAASIHGVKADHAYNGKAICYLETGDDMAAVIPGEYYAYPEPRVSIEAPSGEGHRAKEEFEKPLTTWFEHKDVGNAGRRKRSRQNEEDGSRESVGAC
jgi:sulfide:quinone oxidoreductase